MKKILYLITQSQWGGAQKYVFDLATNLPKNEFETVVVAGEDENGELLMRLRDKKIKTIYLKNVIRAINPWDDFLGMLEIIRLIKKEKPNIIHLNSTKAGILGSLAGFIIKFKIENLDLKIIYTVHGWVFNEPLGWWKKYFYLWAEKITARFKDKIICVSRHDKQIALKNNFPEEKLTVIHNGITIRNLNFLEKTQAREKLLKLSGLEFKIVDSDLKIIGTIANFYPTKGLLYLIEAAKIVKAKYPNILFILIGQGDLEKLLQEKIKELKLENNFYLTKSTQAYQYLKAFDWFVLPSVKEGQPYTILEAMAAGLPIVATRVGGLPEMITDGQNGLLAEPKNSHDLADKIIKILENPQLGESFAEKSREKLEKEFDFEKMLEKTIKVYDI